jgi:hypothetical protein
LVAACNDDAGAAVGEEETKFFACEAGIERERNSAGVERAEMGDEKGEFVGGE